MDNRSIETPLGTTRASELNEPRGRTQEVKDKARDLAGTAKEKAIDAASKQKSRATGELSALAEALRDAGSRLDGENPMTGRFISGAASRIEQIADRIESRDVDTLVRDLRDFARTNQAAFIGGAIALGFIASRFLKASSESQELGTGFDTGRDVTGMTPGIGGTPGVGYGSV